MTDRIVEIAKGPTRLHVRHEQLIIERDGAETVTTPLAELASLVLTNPSVQLTQSVLAGIAQSGGATVICDRNFQPAAMVLPLQHHYLQTERLSRQARMSTPMRKRLWQQIVRAKIRSQSRLLSELHNNDGGIGAFVHRVRSGDPDNLEAQAARRYWPLLFADRKFRRDREAPDQNRHLNYAYAVLRAMATRALCGAGLHPSIGVAHANRYDPFSLAADLMEPFRAVVDRAVASWVADHDPMQPFDPETKAYLVGALQSRYAFDHEARTLFDILAATASGVVQVILGGQKRLDIPEVQAPCDA